MKDIITYYEDGGNSNTEAAVGTEMKRQAKKWQEILKKEGMSCKKSKLIF